MGFYLHSRYNACFSIQILYSCFLNVDSRIYLYHIYMPPFSFQTKFNSLPFYLITMLKIFATRKHSFNEGNDSPINYSTCKHMP